MIRLGSYRAKIAATAVLFILIVHFVSRSSHVVIDRTERIKTNVEDIELGSELKPVEVVKDTGKEVMKDAIAIASAQSKPETTEKVSVKDYSAFLNGLEAFKVNSASLKAKYKTEKAKELFATHRDFLFSKEYLENVLDIPESAVSELKDSHRRYVDDHIKKLVDELQVSTFGNIMNTDTEWASFEGSKGYVIIGGGKYSWLSYLVIRQIRLTGSTIPIELFIPTQEEYEKEFCEVLLPKYNARCNVLDGGILKTLGKTFKVGGYQYKMLAILTSKFENILYLDSDNFPVRNVDYLFDDDIFTSTGLILWPDAWSRTTNPKFYEIANVQVTENKVRYSEYDKKQAENQGLKSVKPLTEYTFADSNFHDFEGSLPNPASETGMILINKTKQLKTLLLAFYYNLLGPDYYYPLMTQGSAGEGDKETFIAAAHVMNQPWHQTIKGFKWVGYVSDTTNKFDSKALCHYDPSQSMKQEEGSNPDIIFAHLSYPKMFPNWLVDSNELIYPDSDKHIRMYGSIKDSIGYDLDSRILGIFAEGFCRTYAEKADIDSGKSDGYMGEYLQTVKGSKYQDHCDDIFIPHAKWLKSTAE